MAKLTSDFMFFQKNREPSEKHYEYFTILGDHDFLDDNDRPQSKTENNKVVAKSVRTDDKPTRFYIKIGTYGKIYNPIGLYSEGKNTKFLSKIGRKQFEFKEVNQKIFDLYLNFLTTKNLAWLNNAERELS
jgi:hypothetical protein